MKKIVDWCDICKGHKENEKCEVCNRSLCVNCSQNFNIRIGDYEVRVDITFCKVCIEKIQLNKTKKGIKFLEKMEEEIKKEVNKKIKGIFERGKKK